MISKEKALKYIAGIILVVGILLRTAVYLQCNSMYIDEANIVRNVFERSFVGLLRPLSYDQYAPPIFLWVVKVITCVFGYSEFGYRLYPFLCGLISLCVMLVVIRRFTNYKAIWYVMLLMALGPIYIHYSTVTKQYIPDMLITLLLIWLALQNELGKRSASRLFFLWAIFGSVAIWSSMPSVFILAGVAAFYCYPMIKDKDFGKLWFLLAAGAVWLMQFLFYYFIILKPQANSGALQNYHKAFFFYTPVNLKIFIADIQLVLYFISTVGGHQVLAVALHLLCILLAIVYLSRAQTAKLLLITVPILAVFFAASLHQYTLIQRVSLFSMPLVLILIAVGLEQMMNFRFIPVRFVVFICAIICFINFNALKNFVYPMQEEEIKLSLAFLKQRNIKGDQLYLHNFAAPAYIYYTQIHPQKEKWSSLFGANIIQWGTNFDELALSFPKRSALLYSWDRDDVIANQQAAIRRHVSLIDSNIVKGGRVYIYQK